MSKNPKIEFPIPISKCLLARHIPSDFYNPYAKKIGLSEADFVSTSNKTTNDEYVLSIVVVVVVVVGILFLFLFLKV